MMTCRFRTFASIFPLALTLSVAHADVTIRYKMEIKTNSALPAQMARIMPQETVLRLKGGKGFSTSMGFNSIIDFTTKEITLLDTAGKRYAKLPYDQYGEEVARAMPEMPAEARAAMPSMKADISPTRVTGRTAVIQGVEAEEREIVVSVAGPAMPNMPSGPMVKLVIHLWSAKPGEVMRVPAIRELTGYSLWSYATMNPTAVMDKMMKQLPGLGGAFAPLMEEMQKGTTVLRVHMDMFMPAMAAMLQRMPAGGNPSGASSDPNEPFMQMNQEVAELSAAPVPDSVFQIPEGYQEAPAADLIKTLLTKSQAAAKQ
jgi:hypothetical protein